MQDSGLPTLKDLYSINRDASLSQNVEAGNTFQELSQGLSQFDRQSRDMSMGSGYSNKNPEEYGTAIYGNAQDDEARAQNQSALGHLAGTLYNTGLELTLGTASMAGRAVDLQSHAAMLTGAQDDANNFFSEWIDTLKEDINYDVYRTNWSKGFNPLSTGWWAEMVPQLASSLTIAVPVGGVMKGLSALGAVNSVAKGLKGMGSLTKSAAGLAGGYKNLSKGVLGGLASRSIESLAEGSETYKQVYSELVNSGYSEEQARGAASEAASSVYKNNWLLSASDMLQYSMVMNGFSKKGELLKQIGLEAGEEGSQYFINKEAEYDALRSVNATPYSSFGERAKTYLSDSEFWNSVVAGGLGGGVFHAVGEFMENRPTPEQKLTHQADKVAEQNATVLAGDKKGKLDYSDDAFRNLALDAITGNKGAELKELYNQTLTATPEELETLSIKPEDVARAKEHIAMIDDIQNEWNALSLNKNLTPDARVIAASSLVESKLKAKRSAQLSKEIIQDIESKIHPLLTEQINGDPNVFNLKIALLNAEALKGTHLEGRFDEQVEKLKALSPGTTLKALSTPEDGSIIAKIKDNYLLQDEINKLKEGYTNANGAMNNEKKATDSLNSVADEANKEKARVKFENETEYPDTHLEKLAKLKNSIYAEVAQNELDKREAARAERKKQEDIEAVNNAKKLESPVETEEPFEETQTVEELEAERDEALMVLTNGDLSIIPEVVEEESDFGDIIRNVIRTFDEKIEKVRAGAVDILDEVKKAYNNPQSSPDGVEIDTTKLFDDDYREFNKSSDNLIAWPPNDAAYVWINNPSELAAGTEVTFKIDSSNEQHTETVGGASIAIYRKSDNRRIGWIYKNRSMELREAIFNNRDAVFSSTITRKSRGPIRTTADHSINTPEQILGENYYIGFGSSKTIMIPNKTDDMNNIPSAANNVDGQVTIIGKGANGMFFPLSVSVRTLSDEEKAFVKSLIQVDTTADNFDKIAEVVNEITYIGRNSGENYPELYLDFGVMGVNYADEDGTEFTVGYDRIGEDDHFDHNLYRILNDPRKKRNVLASKANIIGFPYTDPATQEQYDSYNQFLSKAGVISASYTPMTNGRPTVFGDPFLFFDKNFKLEEGVKKTKTNVGSINNKLPGMGKRMVKSTPVAEPVSTREAKDWFKTNFPNVPLHVVDDVAMILNDGGPAAWGAFVNASVLLAKDAPNSTVYHEAFHVVFDMMLNDKAREAIYQQASKRYNIPLEEIDTIEERLAEEFRNHMILPKESKGVIYDFFKRLYNVIRDFILPNNINIDELFYRASNGIIQTNPRRVRIAEQFKSTAAKRLPVPGFTPEMEEDAVNYIATEFLSLLDERFDKMIDIRQIAEKDVKNFGYIDVIKFEGEERSKNQEQFSAGMQNLLSELKDKIYEQSHDNPALRQIHSKFDLSVKEKELGFRSLKQKAIDVLVDFGVGVRIIEKDATEFMSADIEPIVLKNIDKVEDVETENELKDETRHKEAWMDSYGEAPIEEYKVGPKIKRLFKVIPKLVSYNELDGTYETEVSAFNTIKYVDNRNLFNIVKRELHAEASPTDMVEKLIAVARTSPYKELFIVANWLNTADMHDRSMFFAAFSNAKNNYISVNISTENDNGYDEFDDYYTEDTKDKKYRVRIVENNRNTVTKGIQHEWRKMFVAKAVDPTSKSGEYTKTFLASEAEAFASLPKDITTIDQGLGAISNYFKAIGIDLDMIAVKNQFGTNIANVKGLLYSPNGSITAVHKVIVAGADPFNSQGSLFKSLSQAYKNYYPELGSDNIKRGAKTIHTFANKTFLTKMVERIKGNPESLTEFEYNSIWARLLKSNPAYRNNFNEYILSEVKVDKKSGVEYDNLTPVDDVLQKVLLFHNNDSNKALYNTLTPADNAVMRLISFQKFQRPDVVQFLRMHYGMELARIIKATAFHDKIKNETDPVKKQELMDHLIENYDYKKGDDKLSRTGNVFKLQNFKSNVFYELTSKIIASSKGPDSKINMTTDDIAVFNQEINRMINNEAVFFKNILTKFGKLDAQTNTSQYFDVKNVDELLLDFVANSWLTNIEQTNLFMGGSEFYKDPIDAGKRASQLVAPGVDRNPETDLGQGSSDTIKTIVIQTEKFVPKDGPYKDEEIDYTDAQGFCSVEEFLDVQSATGNWDYTLEKTQDRLLNGEPTLFADKLSLQPLKPHYYGRIEDPVRGLSIPIQVKYAEVPLTGPYVEGNEKLTMLRNYMKEHNIQQAVFDTTIKVGTQQKISWKDIADNKKPFVYELKKENYKRQTEVPEHHIDNEILFGTQLRKLILSGLNMSDETKSYDVAGVMMSAKEVFDLYQDLTARNVIESTNNLKDIVKSPRKLLKKFKEQVIKDGLSSQYDLSLKLKDGRLIIPPTMSKAFEFLYNSMFNKVIKQKIKGGQFVQVAPVGNEDLQFVRNDKGIITEAEVLLPWWTREFIPIGKDGEPDMTKIPEAVLKAVGYRIPTEAKYSMLSFKVKGFLPKDAGSQIVCAPEVVKQMGSDFDVDKLYVMFYEFDSKGNKLEYGDINESTTKQRNNKMLDLIRAILANGQHFDEIVSGNNFDDLIRLDESINGKQAKRDIYSLPSFQYQLRINNLDGAKLIGLAANTNIHHSVAQFIDVKIGDTVEDMVKFNNDGKTPSDLEALSLSNTKNVKGESIASVLAQFLAAFVDNAKNPLAAKLNINFLTHPIASLIIRTGNTMDTAMMFINQPIVKAFVEEYVAAGATPSAYTRTLTKYRELFKNVQDPKAGILSTKQLQDGLKNDMFDPFQKKVLSEFDRLYNISKGINKSIQALRIDSSGVSTNITDNVRKMRNVRDSIVSSIANTSNVFENNMYPMIPAFTDVLAESVENSVDYFPWANPVFEKIHSDVNPQGYFLDDQEVANIDLEYLNYVHQDLAYIKNNTHNKQYVINHLGAKINKILNSYLNSDKSLDNSKKIAIFAENFFIKNLNIEDGKISMSTVDFSTNEKEKLLDAFRTLYNSKESFILEGDVTEDGEPKPTYISNVANGLILYQFFTTGFRKRYGTYLEYLPVDILESLDFTDFWGNKLEEFRTLTNDVRFPELYLRNHSNFGKAPVLQADQVAQIIVENKQPVQIVTNDKMFGTPIVINHLGNPYALRLTGDGWSIYNRVGKLGTMDINEYTEKSEFPGNNFEEYKGEVKPPVIADNPKLELPAGGTINVYWGQPESATSTRILSNLAPRKFNYESIDGVTREYGSVEHAYQSNKNGKFDKNTYDAYVAKGGYGVKIAPKLTEVGKRGNLQVMKDLVVESFVQNPNSNAAKKLMQYNNFTHNTNELIDKAFLEGLKLAQQALSGIPSSKGVTLYDKMNQVSDNIAEEKKETCKKVNNE